MPDFSLPLLPFSDALRRFDRSQLSLSFWSKCHRALVSEVALTQFGTLRPFNDLNISLRFMPVERYLPLSKTITPFFYSVFECSGNRKIDKFGVFPLKDAA